MIIADLAPRRDSQQLFLIENGPRAIHPPHLHLVPRDRPVLRPYQRAMVRDLYRAIRKGDRRLLMIAVMGAGKTVIAAHIMADAIAKGRRAVFLIGLDVLAGQTAATLDRFGVHASTLAGGRKFDPTAPVAIAAVQTIERRLSKGAPLDQILGSNIGVIIADEAHIVAWSKAYGAIDLAYPDVAVVGLTATPWRRSRKQWLGQKFETTILGPQPPEIIRTGGAVPCRWFGFDGVIDIETLETRSGEYTDASIAAQAIRPDALALVFREWERLASDRPTMMVGSTVDQAIATASYFRTQGIPTETIVGDTPGPIRRAIFDRVKRGETKVITSVGCLTAGFDLPAISCILMVRATKSKALFHQIAGRGSRPYPGKTDYLLLDFGGNTAHGNPMGYQKYEISEPRKSDRDRPTEKDCDGCGAVVPIFARVCPECGYIFNSGTEIDEDEPLSQMGEIFDKHQKAQILALRKWRRDAFEKDQNPSEPIEKFVQTYGFIPSWEWTKGAVLQRKNASLKRRNAYLDWVTRHCQRPEKLETWTAYHLALEFGADVRRIQDLPWWWARLGIPPGATQAEVTAAYQRAIRAETLTPQEFQELNQAYDGAIEDTQGEAQ